MNYFKIYAITPLDYGIFVCEVQGSVDSVIADLSRASPTWQFFAKTRLPDDKAIGRQRVCRPGFSYEQTTEGETRDARPKGRPPRKCRDQETDSGESDLPREGTQPTQPEVPGETFRAEADRPDGSGARPGEIETATTAEGNP